MEEVKFYWLDNHLKVVRGDHIYTYDIYFSTQVNIFSEMRISREIHKVYSLGDLNDLFIFWSVDIIPVLANIRMCEDCSYVFDRKDFSLCSPELSAALFHILDFLHLPICGESWWKE
jgi:hypothetical protein